MSVKVLGISTSPRRDSNSDLLLQQALDGAKSAGAETEYIRLRNFNIAPCVECNYCFKKGVCRVEDDYQVLSSKMLEADRLIFATPIFFMTVCAQAKALIDRCQCLWAHKYVLKQPLISASRDRRAMVIAVGGTKSKKMFDSVRLTAKYFLDVLEINYTVNLFVNKIDEPGQIKEHPTAMDEAYRLGRELTEARTPPPEKPINVELT
jgi:multimeric flavodoxin WrbA